MAFDLKIFIELMIIALLAWSFSFRIRRVDFVDILWGLCFVYVGVRSYFQYFSYESMNLLFLFMVVLWGARLAIYLFIRMKKREDKRYQAFKIKYGIERYRWISLFHTFGLQMLLVFVVSTTLREFFSAMPNDSIIGHLFFSIGAFLWIVGFLYESIADYQLYQFKQKSSGICRKGLWAYSRHPNYFGEFLLWWGFSLMAFSRGSILSLVGGLVMSFLLLHVSGVPMLEKSMNEKEGFDQYKKDIPPFLPRIAKHNK